MTTCSKGCYQICEYGCGNSGCHGVCTNLCLTGCGNGCGPATNCGGHCTSGGCGGDCNVGCSGKCSFASCYDNCDYGCYPGSNNSDIDYVCTTSSCSAAGPNLFNIFLYCLFDFAMTRTNIFIWRESCIHLII